MASSNEERIILLKVSSLLGAGLPAAYNVGQKVEPRVPTFFQQNRIDGMVAGSRLCMVDIGSTGPSQPIPDSQTGVEGGFAFKDVVIRIYLFANVLDIEHVNIGDGQKTFGVLDMEQEVWDVLNRYPLLDLDDTIMWWTPDGVDRDQWKAIDPLVGSTISLKVHFGERDKLNP